MSDISELARGMARAAMHEGGKISLDSAIRIVGRLVQTYTVQGKPHEAMGASAAMEMMKTLRDHSSDLFNSPDAASQCHQTEEKS